MRAIAFTAHLPVTDPNALIDVTRDTPAPGPRDLRVAVKAVSVNPVDVKVRAGGEFPPEGRVLGFDAAGIVDAVGADVTLFKPGDAVFYAGAINRPGSNAEFHLVDERIVGRKPATLDFAEAAALPLTAITASELLFERIGVKRRPGADTRSLLIIGGAGGVGSMAIQYAKALTDITIIATASRPETRDWATALGAHHVIDHTKPLAPQLAAIGHAEVDILLSLTATETHASVIPELIVPGGRLGLIEGATSIGLFDAGKLFMRSIQIHQEMMFTRPILQPADMIVQHQILSELAELVDAGSIRTTAKTKLRPINAARLREAHGLVESGHNIGKVVLAGFD